MVDKLRLDPLAGIHDYREALRRMIEGGWVLPRDLLPSPLNAVVIPVDVLDNGTEIVVKASLPGVKPEDVSLSILKGTLTIRATMDESSEVRGATYLRRERRAETFIRTLSLPASVETAQADARYKNGVLTLTLRKSQSRHPRTIKVLPE